MHGHSHVLMCTGAALAALTVAFARDARGAEAAGVAFVNFRPLFNGKNLKGWRAARRGSWIVRDG